MLISSFFLYSNKVIKLISCFSCMIQLLVLFFSRFLPQFSRASELSFLLEAIAKGRTWTAKPAAL